MTDLQLFFALVFNSLPQKNPTTKARNQFDLPGKLSKEAKDTLCNFSISVKVTEEILCLF